MITTIDLSDLRFNNCPDWYKNIVRKVPNIGHDFEFSENFVEASGFDIVFIFKSGIECFQRIIKGDESEIMMMILKWS